MKRHVAVAALLIVLWGCATASPQLPDHPLRPLVIGWEQYFKIDWVSTEQGGRPVVAGRIFNDWGMTATHVRLLVDELGAEGEVIDQRLTWLGFSLTPGTSAPFVIPVAHRTPNYRVSVFAFDWVDQPRRFPF